MLATGESPIDLPFGFEDWNPVLQILFFCSTALISEDATMITAAILAGTQQIHRAVAFLGAFLGIWFGDFILFAIAWNLRSWARTSRRARRWMESHSFARYEKWFARKGWRVLVICRFLPGTRLSCFMTAGYLHMNPLVFGFTTLICAFVWALIIFAIFERVGHAYVEYLARFYQAAWLLVGIIVGGILLLKLAVSLGYKEGRRKWAVRITRWMHWEFWPGWLFYAPPFFHYMYLALRYRSLTLPTITNPGMENGGFIGESKGEILKSIARTGTPFSLPFTVLPGEESTEERLRQLEAWLSRENLTWPVILKPDVGQRGMGVRLAQNPADAEKYLQNTGSAVIAQKPAGGAREAGLFYVRKPDEEHGFLFAATEKVFPVLRGNGQDSLRELIWKDARARYQHKVFFKRFDARLDTVPAEGEEIPLVFAGNHAQGALFLDGSRWVTPKLTETIDELSRKIPGFYFGRYDIRFDTEEDLMEGRNLEIIELNGASSEATSIYDPANPVFSAWRKLFRQWRLAFEIGHHNRRQGHKPVPLHQWFRFYRDHNRKSNQYSVSD